MKKKVKRFITATDARKKLYAVIETAAQPGISVTITHAGLPKVVMMSFEDYEGWMETFDIMSDPEFSHDLIKSLKDYREGKVKGIPWEKVKKEMKMKRGTL